MKIEGSIALVTGANRGLSAAFCRTLLDRGAVRRRDIARQQRGYRHRTSVLAEDALDAARLELETNVCGPLAVSRAFAPTLAANGGGTIVNVLSVQSWVSMPATAIYGASKAAAWSLTNSLRLQLHAQHTQVLGLYAGFIDTDKSAGIDAPKSDPIAVANQTLDGVESRADEVLADDITRLVRSVLSSDLTALYPQLGH